MDQQEKKELEDKIVRIEADLIEQEHRPFRLLSNYFKRKKNWEDPKDIRRSATKTAIFWRLIFSPATVTAGTGGVVAALTLFFLWQQTNLIEQQTSLINAQNQLAEATRRSSQVYMMGEVLSDLYSELEKDPLNEGGLTATLKGRLIALTRAMKPYRFLEGDQLVEKRISPERGQLLYTLVSSPIDSLFLIETVFGQSDFSYSDFRYVTIYDGISFARADLHNSDFENSIFHSYADFSEANLDNANFRKSKIHKMRLNSLALTDRKIIHKIDLSRSEIDSLSISRVHLNEPNLNAMKVQYLECKDVQWQAEELKELEVFSGSLTNVTFEDMAFEGVLLLNIEMENVTFSNANLKGLIVDRLDWFDYVKSTGGSVSSPSQYYLESLSSEEEVEDKWIIRKK